MQPFHGCHGVSTTPPPAIFNKSMKVAKGKYIRLTENDLKAIVKEAVNRELQYIMEYAMPRSKFIDKADGYLSVAFEHIFLVKFSRLSGGLKLEKHWRDEVFTFLTNISKNKIKKANEYDNRKKALTTAFEYNDLFSGYDGVKNLIEAKAIEENINLDSKEAVAAIQYCSECVPVLLELLSVNNVMDIKKFTDNI